MKLLLALFLLLQVSNVNAQASCPLDRTKKCSKELTKEQLKKELKGKQEYIIFLENINKDLINRMSQIQTYSQSVQLVIKEVKVKSSSMNYFSLGFGEGPTETRLSKYSDLRRDSIMGVQYTRMIDEYMGLFGQYTTNNAYLFGGTVGF